MENPFEKFPAWISLVTEVCIEVALQTPNNPNVPRAEHRANILKVAMWLIEEIEEGTEDLDEVIAAKLAR